MEELNSTQWLLFRDSEGRILEEYSVRKIAFHKARPAVWPGVREMLTIAKTYSKDRLLEESFVTVV